MKQSKLNLSYCQHFDVEIRLLHQICNPIDYHIGTPCRYFYLRIIRNTALYLRLFFTIYVQFYFIIMRKVHTSLENHTVFSSNSKLLPKRSRTPAKTQARLDRSKQKNNMDLRIDIFGREKSLSEKKKKKSPFKDSPGKKKKMLIQQIEQNLPQMKTQSAIRMPREYGPDISFRKGQDKAKNRVGGKFKTTTGHNQDLNIQFPIRKVSIMSIKSAKSLRKMGDSPNKPITEWLKKSDHLGSKNTVFMPTISKGGATIISTPMSYPYPQKYPFSQQKAKKRQPEDEFDNSHYNNQKYDNQRYTTSERDLGKGGKYLKNQLRKQDLMLRNRIMTQIGDKGKERERGRDIQDGEKSEDKQVKWNDQSGKIRRTESTKNQKQQTPSKRSKTDMRQFKDKNYHVLADHQKQIQIQKQFLHIDAKKIRDKLETNYALLKKQYQAPEVSINTFKIPKIPSGHPSPKDSLQKYIQLSNELCRYLQYQSQDVNMTIRKYKNCICFQLGDSGHQAVWGFDGRLYVGGWSEEPDETGFKHGTGMEFTSSYCFKGQFRENRREGHGVTQFYNGNVFEGEWKENRMEGKGVFFEKANSTYYKGTWYKGQLKGLVLIKYTKKHYYIGEVHNFAKSGKGREYFQNGTIYEGTFQKDQQSGQGTLYTPSKEFYIGNFHNNKKNGIGLLLTNLYILGIEDGNQESYYYGNFVDGVRCGYGVEKNLENCYFMGYYYNGVPHGPGILQTQGIQKSSQSKEALRMTGIWKNGKITVSGKIADASEKGQSRNFSDVN